MQLLENAEVLQVLGANANIPSVHTLLTHLSHEKYGSNTIRNFTIAVIQSSNTAAGEYTATNVNLPGLDAEHPNQGAFSHSITLARAFTTFVDKGELRALIYLFSRGASAFQNAALAPINSPVCMRIIGHLRETWNISLDVQDVGTCIFI